MAKRNEFDQYKKLLLYVTREHTESIAKLTQSVNKLEVKLSNFEGKVRIMSLFAGLAGGGIVSILATLVVTALRQ